MKTFKQLERVRRAHKFIQQGNTGSPAEFARRLHVSERELYRILEYLREIDAEIAFSRHSNTYYYSEDFELYVDLSIKALVKDELITIYGGSISKNYPSLFSTALSKELTGKDTVSN